ncbi:hypothetical protein BGZ65_010795 [Modicella reniformis]|uniref:Uncharacterized protein n=1 Tax=Modicella reniformis TaxID=1440133 RepID=A0A9P6SUV0_9FUNG|nr:hypothetical protein BGZ65_010795 [Modicella reniformis]
MAVVSENTASQLGSMAAKNRISFREDLNDTHHCDDDGFESDFNSDDEDEDDDDDIDSPIEEDCDAGDERRALKYRKSLTLLNQLAGVSDGPNANETNGAKQPSKEHLLAAKKSIDDLTAWVNAAALGDDDDDDDDDD